MAHKKAAWSAKNLKDSKPKYRWVKILWWKPAKSWNIIIRQKWDKFKLWKNVYKWRDFSVLAKIDWVVNFRKKKFLKFNWKKILKTLVEII